MANRIVFKWKAGRRLLLAGAGMLAVAGPLIRAQSQPTTPVAFEAASVKPQAPGDNGFAFPAFLPGGRFVSKAPFPMVIAFAYNLPPLFNQNVRLTGYPEWERAVDAIYDIEATGVIPPGLSESTRKDRMRLMLQTLLADRFKLKIHSETKELPVYALGVGKGGPKLQKADVEEKDCPDAPVNPAPGVPNTACHSFVGGQGRGLHARAANMSDLVSYVENWTDRPLLDKTGLKGLYHIETTGWLPMAYGLTPPPGAKLDGVDMTDLPTIFALFEKLGLKDGSAEGQGGRLRDRSHRKAQGELNHVADCCDARFELKLPRGEHAIVDIIKVRDYCLNPLHPRGGHKARVFMSALGLTSAHAEFLREELLRAGRDAEAVMGDADEYGERYTIDFGLGRDPHRAMVRSTWIVRRGVRFPRLTSCYVIWN